MKTLNLILTICFLSLGFTSYSQVKTDHENGHHNRTPSPVIKGYYSIGKNAEKLGMSSSFGVRKTTRESYPVIKKGYYSIGDNRKKLGKQLVVEGGTPAARPVIRKGYYSIGNDAEKLK